MGEIFKKENINEKENIIKREYSNEIINKNKKENIDSEEY